jgi:hypothetical protein
MIKRASRSSPILSLMAVALLWQCGTQQLVGGVENGNGCISGKIVTHDGQPAQYTEVSLYPYDNDPRDNTTPSAVSLTDDSGIYAFDTVAHGVYNLMGRGVNGQLCFMDSLSVTNDTAVFPVDTLLQPGQFSGIVSMRPYQPCKVFIVILGTDRYTTTIDAIGNFTSPKLAAGRYRIMIISTALGFEEKDTVVPVHAGQTTMLDTVVLPRSAIDFTPQIILQNAKDHLPGCYIGYSLVPRSPLMHIALVIDSTGRYRTYNTDNRDYPSLYERDPNGVYREPDSTIVHDTISLTSINTNGSIAGNISTRSSSNFSTVAHYLRQVRFNAGFDSLSFEILGADTEAEPTFVALRRIEATALPPRPLPTPAIVATSETPPSYQSVGSGQSDRQKYLRVYADSVTIAIAASDSSPIIYQMIDVAPEYDFWTIKIDNFYANPYWRDNMPSLNYTAPFTINAKGFHKLIVARTKNGSLYGGVTGIQIAIQ